MKRNNGKWRREKKAREHVPGNKGEPHPMGSREFRRSARGRRVLAELAAKEQEQAA